MFDAFKRQAGVALEWDSRRSAVVVLLGLLGANVIPARAMTSGALVGYWAFEEDHGQVVRDTSDTESHGYLGALPTPEVSDPERGTGLMGSGLFFDGYEDVVTIPYRQALALDGQALTLQAWVRPASVGVNGEILGNAFDGESVGYRLQQDYERLRMSLGVGDSVAIHHTSRNVFHPGRWVHVAATSDGSVVRLYVDGRERKQVPAAHLPVDSGRPLFLGRYPGLNHYLHGQLDEVSVVSEAQAPAEILRGHNLVGQWWIDHGGGQALTDDSGRLHHGYLGETPAGEDSDPRGVRESGHAGWGLSFDGVDDVATIPAHRELSPDGAVTVGLQLRPGERSWRDGAVLVDLLQEGAGFRLSLTEGGGVRWEVGRGDSVDTLESVLPLRSGGADAWVTVEASAGHGKLRIYERGEVLAECASSAAPEGGQPLREMTIGRGVGGEAPFAGTIGAVWLLASPDARRHDARARWRFEEMGTTQAVHDEWLRGLDGYLGRSPDVDVEDPLWAPGFMGRALHFDGEKKTRVTIPPGRSEVEVDSTFSIELWFEPETTGSSQDLVTHKWDSWPLGYRLQHHWSAIQFQWGDGAETQVVRSPYGVIEADHWHHLCVTYDGVTIRIYVDGVVVHAEERRVSVAPNPDAALHVGAYLNGAGAFTGRIDEVSILGRALADEEVAGRAFRGHQEEHPRLITSPQERDTLLLRSSQPIFETFFERCLSAADASLAVDLADPEVPEYFRAYHAFQLAVGAWLTDPPERARYLAGARDGLVFAGQGPLIGSDWHYGGTAIHYALAYDAVASFLTPADDREARKNLAALAAGLIHGYEARDEDGEDVSVEGLRSGSQSAYTNMRLREVAGVGLIALAIPSHDDPVRGRATDWLEFVIEDLWGDPGLSGRARGHSLESTIGEDGPFKEGASYINDAFYGFVPFLIALSRNDPGGRYRDHSLGDPQVTAVFRWAADRLRPDLAQPPTDTGWLRNWPTYHGLIAPFSTDPGLHYWVWQELGGAALATWPWVHLARFDVEAFRELAHPPLDLSVATGTSEANLRTGWGPLDTQALLLAEHDPNISPHEHADQGSLLLFARGADLLIDPGDGRSYTYAGNPERQLWIRSAEAHNVVLVDGVGPAVIRDLDQVRDPSRIRVWVTTPASDMVQATTEYDSSGTRVERAVLMVGKDVAEERLYVIDRVLAPGVAESRVRFHLGDLFGDADAGTLSVEAEGALAWEATSPASSKRVRLDIFAGDVPDAVDIWDDGPTEYALADTFDHHFFDLVRVGEEASRLTVLVPREIGEGRPRFERVPTDGGPGVRFEDARWDAGDFEVVVAADGGSEWVEALGHLGTDAAAARVRFRAGAPAEVTMVQGTRVSAPRMGSSGARSSPGNLEPLLTVSSPCNVLVDMGAGIGALVEGDTIRVDLATTRPRLDLSLHGLRRLPAWATWNGAATRVRVGPDQIEFPRLEGNGTLYIGLGSLGDVGRMRLGSERR